MQNDSDPRNNRALLSLQASTQASASCITSSFKSTDREALPFLVFHFTFQIQDYVISRKNMVWHLVASAAFSGFKVVAKRAIAGKCAICGAERLLVGKDADEFCINSNCLLGNRDYNILMRDRYLTACVEEKNYFKLREKCCCGCKGDLVFFDLSPKGSDPRAYCINTSGLCVNSCMGGNFDVPWFITSRDEQREAISYGHVSKSNN